jgi:hypothetical protein
VPGERLCINTSSIKELSYGNRKFWLLVVDDCVDFSWSEFLERKGKIPLIKEFKAKYDYIVKYI